MLKSNLAGAKAQLLKNASKLNTVHAKQDKF